MRRNIGIGAIMFALLLLTASQSSAGHHRRGRGCGGGGCSTGCQTASAAPCGGCTTGSATGAYSNGNDSIQQQNAPPAPAAPVSPSDANAPLQNAPPAPEQPAPRPSASAPKAANVAPVAATGTPTTYYFARGFGRRAYRR